MKRLNPRSELVEDITTEDFGTDKTFGFIALARQPYSIFVNDSPNVPKMRKLIALVHEMLHAIQYTYKIPLKHEHLHILAVNIVTEIVPTAARWLKQQESKGVTLDASEALRRAALQPDSAGAASTALLGLLETLRNKGVAQVGMDTQEGMQGVYDEIEEDGPPEQQIGVSGVYDENLDIAVDLVEDMFDLEEDTDFVGVDELDSDLADEIGLDIQI